MSWARVSFSRIATTTGRPAGEHGAQQDVGEDQRPHGGVYHRPSLSSGSSGWPGRLSAGIAGMPLKPPSSAEPIRYWLPEVALTSWNRITETVSVMTPI